MKFFLNELPWWVRLDSGLDWSQEERIVSGVIIRCGAFFSLIPFFTINLIFKIFEIETHNAALISIIIAIPPSMYLAKIVYQHLWRGYYERAEANAKRRLKDDLALTPI
jgi:hypothetical protein